MSDRPKSTPAPPDHPEIGDVAIRYTFRVSLVPAAALALDQTVCEVCEVDCAAVDFPSIIEAAAADLASVTAFLDYYGDNGGDGPERHEIHLAAAVLDALPVLAGVVGTLRAQVQRARDAAPAESE